jgi:hypothetical protein
MQRFLLLAAITSLALIASGGCNRAAVEAPKDDRQGLAIRISPEGTDAAEPAIAGDVNGNMFVAYIEHSGELADLYVQKYDANGKISSDRVRVNPTAGEVKAWKGDPPTIAVGQDRTVYVGWTRAYTGPNTKGTNLVLSVSKNGGQTFDSPVKINDDEQPASHGMHSMAIDDKGRIFSAWLDERNIKFDGHAPRPTGTEMHHDDAEPNSEVFYSVSEDGGKTFAANKKIATGACPCCKTAVLAAADGTVYISWRQVLKDNYRHIAVSHSNDGGKTFSEGTIVSDDKWQLFACPVAGAALASSAPQKLDVVWYTAGSAGAPGMYLVKSSDSGKTFGSRMLIDDKASASTPVVLTNAGKTTALFTDTDLRIFARSLEDPGASSSMITDGSVPAAIYSSGKLVTALTRKANSKSEVWLISR